MKTFVSDIIPSLQRFSHKLDNLTILTNQHWVLVDDINVNKVVYIFRTNNDLLISYNGKVEKAKWEYLGNNSLLVDKKDESLLFKHGFFDENILALKVDNKNEYAFFINENKYGGELNSLEKVNDFLAKTYIESELREDISNVTGIKVVEKRKIVKEKVLKLFDTNKGQIEIEHDIHSYPDIGNKAFLKGEPAPEGKYKIGFLWYVHIANGKITKITLL